MKNAIIAAVVILLAGLTPLSQANGTINSRAATSLFAAPQDPQAQLLRRLEQLSARVAKLEDEITQLAEKNRQLKAHLTSNGSGALPGAAPGQPVAAPGAAFENKGR